MLKRLKTKMKTTKNKGTKKSFSITKIIKKKPSEMESGEKKPKKVKSNKKKIVRSKKHNVSIKAKLIVFSIILSVVPIIVVGGFSSTRFQSTIKTKVGGLTEQLAKQNAAIVNSKLSEIEKATMLVRSDRELKQLLATKEYETTHKKYRDETKMQEILWNVIVSNPEVRSITLLRNNGDIITAGSNAEVQEFLKSGVFQKTETYEKAKDSRNKVYWVSGLLGNYNKMHAMRDISDYYSVKEGVIIFEIDTRTVDELFENINMGEGSKILITDTENNIIYSSAHEYQLAGEESNVKAVTEDSDTDDSLYAASIPADVESGTILLDKELVAYSTFEDGWKMISVVPLSYLLGDVDKVVSMTITLAIVCIIVAVLLSIYITLSITNPLKKIMGLMSKVEDGDLTVRSDLEGKNEIGKLSIGFNHMIDNMRKLIKDTTTTFKSVENSTKSVDEIAEQYTMVSEQVAVSMGEIANGSSEQARHAEETTNIMSQLSSSIDNMAKSIQVVNEATDKTKDISSGATKTIKTLYEKTEEYAKISGDTKDIITKLESSVSEIINIVDLIKSISEQTNLLALNAAIEAARSGEAGKGFAVVADEIRKLAEQSKMATNKITGLANDINADVSITVETVGKGEKIFGEQHFAVTDTETAFKDIVNSIESIVSEVEEVNQAVGEITEYKNNTIDAIESIAAVTEEAAAGTEEVMASTQQQSSSSQQLRDISQELITLVDRLNESIDQFKVNDEI